MTSCDDIRIDDIRITADTLVAVIGTLDAIADDAADLFDDAAVIHSALSLTAALATALSVAPSRVHAERASNHLEIPPGPFLPARPLAVGGRGPIRPGPGDREGG